MIRNEYKCCTSSPSNSASQAPGTHSIIIRYPLWFFSTGVQFSFQVFPNFFNWSPNLLGNLSKIDFTLSIESSHHHHHLFLLFCYFEENRFKIFDKRVAINNFYDTCAGIIMYFIKLFDLVCIVESCPKTMTSLPVVLLVFKLVFLSLCLSSHINYALQ